MRINGDGGLVVKVVVQHMRELGLSTSWIQFYWLILQLSKDMYIYSSRETCFSFLNMSIPFLQKEKVILNPKKLRCSRLEAPFIDKISDVVKINNVG